MCRSETVEESKEIVLATMRRITMGAGVAAGRQFGPVQVKSRIFGLKWK